MTFRVGQKVVCLVHVSNRIEGRSYPEKGGVYTVRSVFASPATGKPLIRLCELHNPLLAGIEYGFRASAFRPVVERKTDISIFTAMLNPSKQGVEA